MSRPIDYAVIQKIREFNDLISVLRDNLDWDIQELPVPDLTFEFTKQELKLKTDDADIKHVRLFRAPSDLSWGIIFVDFGQDRLRRSSLRQILNAFAQKARKVTNIPAYPLDKIVFFCRHDGTAWTIANYKGDKPGTAKLESFGWHDPEEARTAIENLSKLKWRGNWQEAWDVKSLTDGFFKELSDLFFGAIEHLKPQIPDEHDRRLFVQTIFNRLIFLRFVEKKGWLKLDGRQDYLKALWNASKEPNAPSWHKRLAELFNAVNDPNAEHRNSDSNALIGEVVYLNGGLFDRDARLEDPALALPIETYQRLVSDSGLFYRYNFTVEESSPLDVQVAVDPEILGKIFEQLTISSKRHDTGSYYTPREIVQFMCREALVGYLGNKGIAEDKARKLVYEHDDSDLTNQEGNLAFEALKAIKVVDPACGSGAYLLGMLQELYALFEILRREGREFSPDDKAKEAHKRKLWIIENNLYGVDLQAFATNTAMLRLWLTLLVEDTGSRPQPLPNLEYKIETGDSLLGPDPSQPVHWHEGSKKKERGQSVLYDQSIHTVVEELRRLREQYQNAHGPAKTRIKTDLEAKLAELREKVTGSPQKNPAKFDWRVEFFDVFLDDPNTRPPGFDVALANPPYIKYQLLRPIRPLLKVQFTDTYDGEADILVYFYDRALSLITAAGAIAFITSNQWLKAEYGRGLRKKLGTKGHVRFLVDYDDKPVFEAIAYPLVLIASTGSRGPTILVDAFRLNNWKDNPETLVREHGRLLPEGAINGDTWFLGRTLSFAEYEQMRNAGLELGLHLENAGIGHIRVGLNTGCNEAFYVDAPTASRLASGDEATAALLRPLTAGGDIGKWAPPQSPGFVVALKDGPEEVQAVTALAHMSRFRERLTRRTSRGRMWYQLRACTYYDAFESPGIVFPDIAPGPRFTRSEGGKYLDYTAFVIPCDDLYLLGVLNSKAAHRLFCEIAATIRGGYLRYKRQYVERIPIPRASDADRDAIEALVQQILDLKTADPEADASQYEAEIDARVDFLYFHQSEAPAYDAWVSRHNRGG